MENEQQREIDDLHRLLESLRMHHLETERRLAASITEVNLLSYAVDKAKAERDQAEGRAEAHYKSMLEAVRADNARLHHEKEDALDRLSRTEENVAALKGELEGVKTMWRRTIEGNQHLTAELDKANADLRKQLEDAEHLKDYRNEPHDKIEWLQARAERAVTLNDLVDLIRRLRAAEAVCRAISGYIHVGEYLDPDTTKAYHAWKEIEGKRK